MGDTIEITTPAGVVTVLTGPKGDKGDKGINTNIETITVSDTPPVSPAVNDLWVDTSS